MTQDFPIPALPTGTTGELRQRLGALGDRALVTSVMDVLAHPPEGPADSFVLHAPLELMARAELLPSADPPARDVARARIVEIAEQWLAQRPHLDMPDSHSAASLPAAIAAGDADGADHALVDLARTTGVEAFTSMAADQLLGHLGGAGHLAIFLDQLRRFPRPPRSAITAGRALVRDIARNPGWTLGWIDAEPPSGVDSTHDFVDVLVDPPDAGDPGSNFIYPTMHLVDASGLASRLLAGPVARTPVDEARRQLLRVAAMSMLQDDPANAPYGWSHCLTMPQAALALGPQLAEPRQAVAVAATYVLGFRATQSSVALDVAWEPARPGWSGPLLEADADDAVAQAWHTERPDLVERELASHAAAHHDAHLAKYTLACLHAAHDDEAAAPLFRAAAARLATWWRDADEADQADQADSASSEEGSDDDL